jgi:hypothetical protein
VRTQNTCAYFAPGMPVSESVSKNSPANKAIPDSGPRPKLAKLLITGLVVSVAWTAAILVYGKAETNLAIDTPVVLTLLTGVPLGALAFTLLRLLKNVINKSVTAAGQKTGGNLLGWIVSTLLPWASPVIVDAVMASAVFHAKIF